MSIAPTTVPSKFTPLKILGLFYKGLYRKPRPFIIDKSFDLLDESVDLQAILEEKIKMSEDWMKGEKDQEHFPFKFRDQIVALKRVETEDGEVELEVDS